MEGKTVREFLHALSQTTLRDVASGLAIVAVVIAISIAAPDAAQILGGIAR